MHVKRLLIGSILYLYIALCFGHDNDITYEFEDDFGETVELEVNDDLDAVNAADAVQVNEGGLVDKRFGETVVLEKDTIDTIQVNKKEILGEEVEFEETDVVENVKAVELDEEMEIEEEEILEEDLEIDGAKLEVNETITVKKKPKKVKEVVKVDETVVVDKKPKIINHEVVSNGGTDDEFYGKKVVEKKDNVQQRELFLNDGVEVRKFRNNWGKDIFKFYGQDRRDEFEEVTELEDEDRFGDGTLAQLLGEFLLDPLDAILELLKQTLRSVVANLDHILEQVFKVLAALLNVVLVVVLDVLILVVHILADLIPGVFGKSFNKYDGYVTECVEKVKMDPITTSLIELEQCVTDPLFHIIENLIIILTDVQEILGEIDQGLRQLEVVRKAEEAFTDIVAIVLDVVERVLETVEDLVEGPIADILVIIPVLLACILGDIGKNLLGGLLNLLKKYVACTTYVDGFGFNSFTDLFIF